MKNKTNKHNQALPGIRFIRILSLVLLAFGFASCEKDIEVDLPEYKEKLVVEASIETGQPATVFLSFTAPYFGEVDFSDPTKFFVKNAFVTVSDGNVIDTLKEVFPGQGYFYMGSKIFGQVGGSYLLNVVIDNKTYTSFTNILQPIALDSIYFKGEVDDTLGYIWAHINEPAGFGNNYRFFAKRANDQFYAAPFNSAFDDKFIDGKSFEFAYERGAQPNAQQVNEDDEFRGLYSVGDTVIVKFCTMGRSEYEFWRSYYSNQTSNGNPFASPTNIKSTISGGNAIGAFCGYSPSFDTLIIKKKP